MSMIGNLLRVTQTELDDYLNDSSLLESLLYENLSENENQKLTDIDKTWDGIIFLLTGGNLSNSYEHPLTKILFSGQLIDEEQDLGYGPAHYLTVEQVKELNNQIAKITIYDLRKNFNPKQMMELEVYPNIWDEGDEAFEYLSEFFLTVQEAYAEASKNGEAMITFLN